MRKQELAVLLMAGGGNHRDTTMTVARLRRHVQDRQQAAVQLAVLPCQEPTEKPICMATNLHPVPSD